MTSPELEAAPGRTDHSRWRFLRDVAVFQLKMLLDNLRDFALMPISLGAALIDLFYKGEREGALFYRVLRWGSHSEEVIDVYSPIKHETRDFKINPNYTVDGVIARLENVVVREYEKGGTAASIKSAMDHAIDELHRGTSGWLTRPPANETTGQPDDENARHRGPSSEKLRGALTTETTEDRGTQQANVERPTPNIER